MGAPIPVPTDIAVVREYCGRGSVRHVQNAHLNAYRWRHCQCLAASRKHQSGIEAGCPLTPLGNKEAGAAAPRESKRNVSLLRPAVRCIAWLGSGCELNVHRIRSGKLPPVAPPMIAPNVKPPVGKGLGKRFLAWIMVGIPIDSYAV
jgi:hypothetical protein